MELKFRDLEYSIKALNQVLIVPLWNWNFVWALISSARFDVLIVPLWNWNMRSTRMQPRKLVRSNRTFMELKFDIDLQDNQQLTSSNRTFMELKYRECNYWPSRKAVLIVPLWNWNQHQGSMATAFSGSNRTFMELKFSANTSISTLAEVLIVPLWNWNGDILCHNIEDYEF